MSDIIRIEDQFPTDPAALARYRALGLNDMAAGLKGSMILRIAGEIRALQDEGKPICNLTVGDFAPQQFRIPARLREDVKAAYDAGQTNYPPAVGLPRTREAVRDLYERDLGLDYPVDGVVMGSGARPPIYATFALVVQPGDKVVYSIPSWNNHYYCHLRGARVATVVATPETDFLPTAEQLAPVLEDARLLCLNSPLNPTGTALKPEQLAAICDLVLDINARRAKTGARPLMLMYDQVYWMICHGGTKHVTPVGLRPAMARYTIFVDAISKSFAATGLRVGWAVVPPPLLGAFQALIGHMGAWPPRPEQVATERLLRDPDGIRAYHSEMLDSIARRLYALHEGFEAMAGRGLPVRSIAPQGGIYLSVNFPLIGRSHRGRPFATNEDVRSFLLDEAGFGVVPFQAFGLQEESGWMRLSVGAVSMKEIADGLSRIEDALGRVG